MCDFRHSVSALAVARHLQDAAGTSIKKIIQTLRTARSATIEINGQRLTPTSPTPPATSSSRSNQVTKRLARVRSGSSDMTVSPETASGSMSSSPERSRRNPRENSGTPCCVAVWKQLRASSSAPSS